MNKSPKELSGFLQNWQNESTDTKKAFLHLKESLDSLCSIMYEFVVREEVTFSLRIRHHNQRNRPLFAIIDVIEDQPRWLSVCFYADMINDPDRLGDVVPNGILGEDAVCFDLADNNKEFVQYLVDRIKEAYATAAECGSG